MSSAALLEQRIREHNLPQDAFQWYLDLRRYGSVPHAGFRHGAGGGRGRGACGEEDDTKIR